MKAARSACEQSWFVILALCLLSWPCASAETLTVHVRDGQTGDPLSGAFVMIGPASGIPFDGNVAWTDGAGMVVFESPALAQAQTVTAGAEEFAYTTLIECVLDEVMLALYPTMLDTLMGGTATRIEGAVHNIEHQPNDGSFDVAVVAPAVAVSSFALADMMPLRIYPEEVEFPVIGPVLLLSNLYMPSQVEFVFFTFEKLSFWFDVPGERTQTFFSVTARVGIDDLLGGTFLESAVVHEVGVERDIMVSGPTMVDIDSDLELAQELIVELDGVPDDALTQAVSAALFMADGRELAVAYDTRGGVPLRASAEYELATMPPQGDLSDAMNIAVGTYVDSSVARAYSSGILDRSGFIPPYTATFDSWMLVPELTQAGFNFEWEDPTNPGISPPPTWTRSNLGLRAIDPADTTIVTTTHWRIYAPAEPRYFRLPLLPAEAPGPQYGLPDPSTTADEDQLYWQFLAANPAGDLDQILDDFMRDGTHWSSSWIPMAFDPTSAPDPSAARSRLVLAVSPSVGHSVIRLAWDDAGAGDAILEITGSDGRLVWREAVAPGRSGLLWRGRDRNGHAVPAGVYWARLWTSGGQRAQGRWVWLR